MNRIDPAALPHAEATVHEISDEALMQRYAVRADTAAFESLFRRHRASLLRYMHRHTGAVSAAEELFQDVWLAVVRTRTTYRPSASFRSWLFTLAHNRLVDHYRAQGRARAVMRDAAANTPLPEVAAPESATPQARSEQQQLAALLLELIHRLPQEQRDAFLLREEGGFSVEEIARITGVGLETAKSRLRYAIARLRHGLETSHAS